MTGSTGRIAVGFGDMGERARTIQTSADAISNRLLQLESDLNSLKAAWTGSSAEAYQQAKRSWDEAINHMKMTLAKSGGAVQDAGDGFRHVEKNNTALF